MACAIRQQAVTWASVVNLTQILTHVVLLGHKELSSVTGIWACFSWGGLLTHHVYLSQTRTILHSIPPFGITNKNPGNILHHEGTENKMGESRSSISLYHTPYTNLHAIVKKKYPQTCKQSPLFTNKHQAYQFFNTTKSMNVKQSMFFRSIYKLFWTHKDILA